MIGNERTFFTASNCIRPFVMIGGMVHDLMCSELLTISEIRQELHRHLRANGFDAVFFYDPQQVLSMYDMESSFVLHYQRIPSDDERRRFTLDRGALQDAITALQPEPEPVDDGVLVLEDWVIPDEAPIETLPERIYTPLRSYADTSQENIRQQLRDVMTRDNLRCALVYYNLEQWKVAMSESDLELLSELDRLRDTRRSITVFLIRSEPGQDVARLLTQGALSSSWSNFAGQYLLPGLERREDTPEPDYRLITLGAPGKGELRNFITMLRLRRENPLRIDPGQLELICTELAANCSEKNVSLRLLYQRISEWQESHPDAAFSADALGGLLGSGRYRTVTEELNDTIGLDNLRDYVNKKSNQQRFEQSVDSGTDGLTRLTPPPVFSGRSSFDLNLLLMGNPGTGKSKSAEMLGKLFREMKLLPRGHCVPLKLEEMMAPDFSMDAAFRRALGGVLLIDEAYKLMDRVGGERVLNDLTECMSQYAGQLSVVLAGYKERLLDELLPVNPGLGSRFPQGGHIDFPPYSPDELRRIFLKMAERTQGLPLRISDSLNELLPDFFENWVRSNQNRQDWGNAREAQNLLDAMRTLCTNRYGREGRAVGSDGLELTREDLPEKLRELTRPLASGLDEALRAMDKDIIGLDNVKDALMNVVHDIQLHGAANAEPGAYLFLGPPGTGKSMMADQFAALLYQLRVITNPIPVKRTAKELLEPPHRRERPGEHTNPFRNGLRDAAAEARGGLLFIDEAHQLGAEDTRNGAQSGTAILHDLVPLMEDPVFRSSTCLVLAGYTGPLLKMLNDVDPGFPSRFPKQNRIRFTNYSAAELTEIMKSFAKADGDILDEEFVARTRVALSRFLPDADPDFGNARFIRKEYLPAARAKRDHRLLAPLALGRFEAPTEEQLRSIGEGAPEARKLLTKWDIPDLYNLAALAGPPDTSLPPELTPEQMLNELYDKDKLLAFVRNKANPDGAGAFMDVADNIGINFALTGPTGCGRKTAIAAIAELYARAGLIDSKEVYSLDRGSLVAGYVGQTPRQTEEAVAKAQGGMCVILNPSSLFKSDASGNDFGPEAVQALAGCIGQYSGNTCFVLVDSKAGLEHFFKNAPSYRRSFQNVFHLNDLSINAMQKIFDGKTRYAFAFEESIRDLMKGGEDGRAGSFIANWVTDRGGLGDAFQNWTNGAEIDALVARLRDAWESDPDKQTVVNDEGYTVRLITRRMFDSSMQKYMKETSQQETEALEELKNKVGWTRVKYAINLIRTKLATAKNPDEIVPGNYLFIGNSGTGKTDAAQLMGNLLRSAHALKQGYVITRTAGQMMDSLGDFDQIIQMARENVLFIDEAHQLAEGDGRGRQVMKRLLTVLEDPAVRKDTCIILAGYPQHMDRLLAIDPGLRNRFGTEESRVYFDDYTPEELVQIMRDMAVKKAMSPEIGARAPLDMDRSPEFAARAATLFRVVVEQGDPNFGNARFVRTFLHNAVNRQILRLARQYGEGPDSIPQEEYALLTREDIPEREDQLLRDQEQRRPIDLTVSMLSGPDWEAMPIDEANASERKAFFGRSVMLLEARKDGRVIGYGTGFVITKEGHILTCAHVVRGADAMRARMYWPGLPGGPTFWFDCDILFPAYEHIDMALLKVVNGQDFVPLHLRKEDRPAGDAEHTMVLGYPFGKDLNPDLSELVHNHFLGHVSSIQRAGTDRELYYISGEGKAGNSGSPVISQVDGYVVGVFDGSRLHKGEDLTEEMNYFTSIRLFWKYLVRPDGQPSSPIVPTPVIPPESEDEPDETVPAGSSEAPDGEPTGGEPA